MNKSNKIFKNETIQSLKIVFQGKSISFLLSFITIAIIVRSLNLEGYARLTLFFSVVELLNIISLPGFNVALNKLIHHKKSGSYKLIYKYSFFSSCIFGFIIISIITILKLKIYPDDISNDDLSFAILTILFIIFRSLEKHNSILPALRLFKKLSWFTVISSFLRFLGLCIPALIFKSVFPIMIGAVVYQVILSIISFTSCLRILKSGELSMETDFVKEGIQFTFINFFNTGVQQIDRLILFSLSPEILAIYQAGISYPEKLREFSKTFVIVITNRWLSFGNDEYVKRLKNNLKYFIPLSLLFILILFFTPEVYIPLLLGTKYIKSIPIASYIGVIIILKLINHFLSSRETVYGNLKLFQLKIFSYKVLYLILLVVFIKEFLWKGVIVSLFTSELFFLILLVFPYIITNRKYSTIS